MTRRTLDIIFAIGGLLVLVLGPVLQDQASSANDGVEAEGSRT